MRLRNKCSREKKNFAKKLRKNPTSAESFLWNYLRCRKMGVRFRRQAVLRGYIADFWCPQKFLVVEVDGPDHSEKYDRNRDSNLAKLGITTLRFKNEQVFNNIPSVLQVIAKFISNKELPTINHSIYAEFSTFPQPQQQAKESPNKILENTIVVVGPVDCVEKQEKREPCKLQIFANTEVAENTVRFLRSVGITTIIHKCAQCNHIHIKES